MTRITGTQVARNDSGLFVEFSGGVSPVPAHAMSLQTLTATPTQITKALADLAAADHNVVVLSVLAALEYERHSDERCVGSLWLALERAVQLWRTERIEHSVTPAASTRQALGGTRHE